jgi:uncharacterized protein
MMDASGPLVLSSTTAWIGQSVVFRTDEGTKLDAAAGGAPVASKVDGINAAQRIDWSILIRGSAVAVTEPGRLRRVQQLPLISWAPGRSCRSRAIGPI